MLALEYGNLEYGNKERDVKRADIRSKGKRGGTLGEFKTRRRFALAMLTLTMMVLAACTSLSGKTTGENIDDAQITAAVKSKLAAEKLATLTRVGVETNLRTVYLTGVVDSEETRQRAAEIAWSVPHVNGVVNHLTIQQKG
jgi:osmotically-inducible protein OsmY